MRHYVWNFKQTYPLTEGWERARWQDQDSGLKYEQQDIHISNKFPSLTLCIIHSLVLLLSQEMFCNQQMKKTIYSIVYITQVFSNR